MTYPQPGLPDGQPIPEPVEVEQPAPEKNEGVPDGGNIQTQSQDHAYHNVPGEPEFWKDSTTGQIWVVYFVPNSDPPIPLAWAATEEEMQGIIGENNDIEFDKILTTQQLQATGMLDWGNVGELVDTHEDPFEQWANKVESAAAVRPWLRDPEVLGLIAMAMLEGRDVTLAEFQQTEWWRTHNKAERNWLLLYESDPETAAQARQDNRITVADLLQQAGIYAPNQDVINYMADQFTTGAWSQTYLNAQVTRLSDPTARGRLDPGLAAFIQEGDHTVDTTRENEDRVKSLVDTWLGPAFGRWDQDKIARWAGRLRNDPDGEQNLIDQLQKQRLALFPEYQDQSLSYDDIAQPWRGVVSQAWGQTADETDPFFSKIVRTNDIEEATRLLRSEGLKRNNRATMNSLEDDFLEAFGDRTRGRLL